MNDMTHLTHLTDYFTESSRVPRTHGTREKVDNKCVKSVKSVNFATDFGGAPAVCRKFVCVTQQAGAKKRKKLGMG